MLQTLLTFSFDSPPENLKIKSTSTEALNALHRMTIKETLLVLWTKLQPLEMPVPITNEIWLKTAGEFL